jgi:hypothetical protein
LAWGGHLRYNGGVMQWRRLRLWFVPVLAGLLIVVVALWLRGTPPGSRRSPLFTPGPSGVSPLPTPVPTSAATLSPSWSGAGAALPWVALGVLLALVITVVILYWYRRTAS